MEDKIPLKPAPSLGSAVSNVFASPKDAFTPMLGAESAPSLWAVPLLVLLLVMSAMTYLLFTNATFKEQMRDVQEQALQTRVDEGKMSQEEANGAMDRIESMGGMMLGIGIIARVVMIVIFFFLQALFLWLAIKAFLHSPATYSVVLQIQGTAMWIGILGAIVTLLLMYALNTMYASPSAALAVLSTFNPMSTAHKALAALNIFSLWEVSVAGIGVATVSQKSFIAGIAASFGIWLVFTGGMLALGIG